MAPVVLMIAAMMLMMRGGVFHNRLAQGVAQDLRAEGFQAELEYRLALPTGEHDDIDIMAWRGCDTVAIEVETTARYVAVNAAKAAASGVRMHLWFVTPSRRVRRAVINRLQQRDCFPRPAGALISVQVLLPAEIPRSIVQVFPSEEPFPSANKAHGNAGNSGKLGNH